MTAGNRVVEAWGLLLALWCFQMGFAALLALPLRTAVDAALGELHDLYDARRALAAIADLGIHHPAALAQLYAGTVGTALVGSVFWLVGTGAVLVRLDRRADAPSLFAAAIRHLPAVVGVTLWHLPLRALLVGLPLVASAALPGTVLVPLVALAWLLGTVSLDAAKVDAVLGGAPARSPRTVIRAFVGLFRRPRVPAAAMGLGLLGWCLVLLGLGVASRGLTEPGTLLGVRVIAGATTAVGMWRWAIFVDARARQA